MRKSTLLPALLLLAVATVTGCSVLERDYPSGDPAALSTRLKDRAQWAYDGMALPPHTPVEPARVIPGHSCYAGGFSIEKPARDVVTYELRWTVGDVPADVARATERRLRQRFTEAGWTVTHDGNRRSEDFVELGFRVEDPATGDQFDLAWNDSTTSLFLTGYTPCRKVPSGTADTPSSESWNPRTAT
ncbi:hypothetical protein [Streptomyces sp. NPDC058664]|uniref:hypothetical protein n=1 Tax=unclassified Streptomyces TaxID=2593676 RepID=UPI00365F9C62